MPQMSRFGQERRTVACAGSMIDSAGEIGSGAWQRRVRAQALSLCRQLGLGHSSAGHERPKRRRHYQSMLADLST